jgi:hypothetical protein
MPRPESLDFPQKIKDHNDLIHFLKEYMEIEVEIDRIPWSYPKLVAKITIGGEVICEHKQHLSPDDLKFE